MTGFGRQFVITLVAYVAGIIVAAVAMLAIIDLDAISLRGGLPRSAMTTPMVAVVVFWGVARFAGAQVDALRIFLFGGIAIYSLLSLCGRLVAHDLMSSSGATAVGAVALFLLALKAVNHAEHSQ